MKKILILILLFLSFSIKVEAKVEESVITDFFVRDKMSRELYEFNFYNDGEAVLYSTKFIPYVLNYDFDYTESCEEALKLDKDAWNHLKNIIYFGFQYQNHDDILWYALTQAMIYQELGLNYEIVDLNNMNILMSYRTEYMQLRSLVKKHENLPEIYKSASEININYREKFLIGSNDTIKYEWYISDGLLLLQVGNEAYLEGLYPTTSKLTWKSKVDDIKNIIYYNSESQLVTRGGPAIYSDTLDVNVHGSMLKLTNISSDGKVIPNSIFNIYDKENNLVVSLTTNDLGYTDAELTPGNYYIVQNSVNEGYVLNDKAIDLELIDCETKELKIINEVVEEEYIELEVPATGISIRPIFIIISIIALLIGLIFYVKEK